VGYNVDFPVIFFIVLRNKVWDRGLIKAMPSQTNKIIEEQLIWMTSFMTKEELAHEPEQP